MNPNTSGGSMALRPSTWDSQGPFRLNDNVLAFECL